MSSRDDWFGDTSSALIWKNKHPCRHNCLSACLSMNRRMPSPVSASYCDSSFRFFTRRQTEGLCECHRTDHLGDKVTGQSSNVHSLGHYLLTLHTLTLPLHTLTLTPPHPHPSTSSSLHILTLHILTPPHPHPSTSSPLPVYTPAVPGSHHQPGLQSHCPSHTQRT